MHTLYYFIINSYYHQAIAMGNRQWAQAIKTIQLREYSEGNAL
jgi:hypothetical protein